MARKLNGERAITLNVKSHELFGKFSKKYTIKGDILHVRSGSGRGGAIIYAQNKGIKVLVETGQEEKVWTSSKREKYMKQ